MLKNPVVFLADDYMLRDNLEEIEEALIARGIRVIRGPETKKGIKLVYQPEDYERLFSEADVLMFTSRSVCDAQVIRACKKAKAIFVPTIGMETVDLEAATAHNIITGNGAIPENVISVAEFAIGSVLLLSQQMLKSIDATKGGRYDKPVIKNSWSNMLCGRKVGFVGFGKIARAVAERLQFFGVEQLAYSPSLTQDKAPEYVRACSLERVLREADFVGIYVVINKSTFNMINKATLALMKPTAYLINIARGEAINEDDLYDALVSGKLAGAALDTYHIEPLPADSKLRRLDNVILTPHMAGATIDNYRGITKMAVENIMAALSEKLSLYCKNPQIEAEWRKKFTERDT